MSDKISLVVGRLEIIDAFLSYRISSDLFEAADAFSIELADPDLGSRIHTGDRCFLRVNDRTELNGIIDKVITSYDKEGGRRFSVEGRDLMGLLVDSYCTSYPDITKIKLKDLVQQLIKDIPFISMSNIHFGDRDKTMEIELTNKNEEYQYINIRPGQTVYEVLKERARSRGMLLFSLPSGKIVFGQPATSGKTLFRLENTKEGHRNNIISASLIDDISGRYKTVTVVGQRQGYDDDNPGDCNIENEPVSDPNFPLKYKPYVEVDDDGRDPQKYAKLIMDGMLFNGWSLEIRTFGHGQNGRSYMINKLYHVKDEVLNLNQDLLCYSRIFELSKEGKFTTLKLSKPGILPA